MATGLKSNNVIQVDGVSWEDRFAIDAGALTSATRANFKVQVLGCDGFEIAVAYYSGDGALTTSELANFPKGSIIHAYGLATPAIYYKVAAAGTDTWKYQAINT